MEAQMSGLVPFQHSVTASGAGEVWTHSHEGDKMDQFGWRCTNKESSFSNDTLIGNWSEDRFDINIMKKAKQLPSPYNHYFDTTYKESHSKGPYVVPEAIKRLKAPTACAHPGHQPDLDTPQMKELTGFWTTTSRQAYCDPKLQKQQK